MENAADFFESKQDSSDEEGTEMKMSGPVGGLESQSI
jgi:hypothetical protein